jgi:polyphosphate kinase
VLKANGLTDPQVIEALYAASCAGASIDLIVRNRCCVRPGVAGMSEHIRVRSIVGRFLEHSRIYLFGGTDGRPLRVLLGSADPMERNLDRRIEAMVPLRSPALAARLEAVLDLAIADDTNAWELAADGRWSRVAKGTTGVNLQAHLQAQALARSQPADRGGRRRVRERPAASSPAAVELGGVPPLVKLPIPVPERTLAAVPPPAPREAGWWSRLASRLRGDRRPG